MAPKSGEKAAGKKVTKKPGVTALQTADYLEPEPILLHVGQLTDASLLDGGANGLVGWL